VVDRNEVHTLVQDVLAGRINRRELLLKAAAMGIVVPGVLAMQAAADVSAAPRAQDASPTPISGGTLTAIIVDDPKFLDIHVTQLAQSRNMMASIYEALTYVDLTDPTFPLKGRLAESWAFTEPTKLDFKLRSGIKWHDGSDFTADDVKWTIEYIKNPDTASPNASIIDQIDTVEVIDPLTVRMNLKQSWPAIPSNLTTIYIYPKTATKDSLATSPVGTGPFVWKEWIPGDHITITKNPSYWIPEQPYLDQINFRPIKEKATSLSVMQAGDADVFFTPELKDKETIDGDSKLQSADSPVNDSGYVCYVNHNKVLADQNLRLAISYAMDRPTYFEAFLSGQGSKNTSPWAANHWAYNPINDTAFEYDLDKAKSYLEAAGYTDGKKDGTQLSINLVYPSGYPEWKQGSEMFQAAMDELGVEIKVEELELSTWIDRIVTTDEFDISWDYHFQRSVDPAWTLSLAFFYPPVDGNLSRYKDDQMAELISKGGSELDQDKRKDYYFQFQERWNEIVPGLIIGEFLLYHCLAATVEGFITDPLFFQDFRTVWLNK
jgi:peptide/nickel transport system substrate-binding protein